jgi:hypothetical protein
MGGGILWLAEYSMLGGAGNPLPWMTQRFSRHSTKKHTKSNLRRDIVFIALDVVKCDTRFLHLIVDLQCTHNEPAWRIEAK